MSVTTLIKQPTENRLYSMDFSANLAQGETIALVNSVTVTPSGLTLVGSAVVNSTAAQQRISGGTDKVTYKITFIVTTSNGNILEGEGYLRVQEI